MNDGTIVTCPADGCDYQGPSKSVIAHYSGTRSKPDHKGGMDVAKHRLGDEADSSSTGQAEHEPGDEQADEQAQANGGSEQAAASRESAPSQSSGSDPARETPPSDGTSQTSGSDGGDGGCPDCGSELVDFRDLTTGKYHEVQGTSVFVGGDYVCSSCGEWWIDG